MLQTTSSIFLWILIAMVGYSLIKPWLSKDKSEIWSPITIIALCLIYYVIKPSFEGLSMYNAGNVPNQYMFYFSCDIFYGIILYMFFKKKTYKPSFKRWNDMFNETNVQRVAVILFIIAMVCYVPFRGFRTSISAEDATITTARTGLVSYFIDLISLFVAASCLAYVGYKNSKGFSVSKRMVVYAILYFTLVMFIVGGFRYRLVFLILALATTYHLYPTPRKINYIVLIPVAVITYLGFAVMDSARSYGRGIDFDVAKTISLEDASKGAGESNDVCCFSIATIDYCSQNDSYVYFEPIITAALMPIPRSVFPGKPAGEYLLTMNQQIIGYSGAGAAVLVITEAFMMFGIFGVILYALFIGWLCRRIWDNYKYNDNSIGAIVQLAIFNGFCYDWISRGYMGGILNDYIYFIVLPFIIASFILKRLRS